MNSDDGIEFVMCLFHTFTFLLSFMWDTIICITGQDGPYLAKILIERATRSTESFAGSTSFNTGRIEHLYKDAHERV